MALVKKMEVYIFFVHLNDFCDIALAYTIFRFCAIYAPKGFWAIFIALSVKPT